MVALDEASLLALLRSGREPQPALLESVERREGETKHRLVEDCLKDAEPGLG